MEELETEIAEIRIALQSLLLTLENEESLNECTREDMDRIYRMMEG